MSSDAIVTQGETNYARQWFPGWDEPAFRHTFEISAEVPGDWKTVSNGAQTEATKLPDGYQRVAFEKTPSMPMYLTFFGGGKFDILADNFKNSLDGSDMPLRWFTPPGRADWAKFAMEWTKVSMDYYYKYTGIPLPFKKFDTVAANDSYNNKPNTGFGGMENWGSIFEFADSVLTKPGDTPTLYSVTVVTHEVAHQWFGDLVTLDWWDNVWLNESFARWFERRTTIKFHPEYYSFSDYVLDKHTVIVADLKNTAVPVQRNLNDAGSFGFISPSIFVYNKGSHVLETIQNYIGEEGDAEGPADLPEGLRVRQRHAFAAVEFAGEGHRQEGERHRRQPHPPDRHSAAHGRCAVRGQQHLREHHAGVVPQPERVPGLDLDHSRHAGIRRRDGKAPDLRDVEQQHADRAARLHGRAGRADRAGLLREQLQRAVVERTAGQGAEFASNKPLLLNIERDAFRLLSVGRITQAQYDQIKGVVNLPATLLAKTQVSQQKMAAVDAGVGRKSTRMRCASRAA